MARIRQAGIHHREHRGTEKGEIEKQQQPRMNTDGADKTSRNSPQRHRGTEEDEGENQNSNHG
jgi:hypothetical protein